MSSLDQWAEDFGKAIRGYRESATSEAVYFSSGKLFSYMMHDPESFPDVVAFVDKNGDWGPFRMKDMIGKYLDHRGMRHRIYPVTENGRNGGGLYTYKKAAGVFAGDE